MNERELSEIIEKQLSEFVLCRKNEFVEKSCKFICSFLDNPFYAWMSDDNPYDHSGVIETNGTTNRQNLTTLEEYLKFHIGEKIPSYCSGCGFFYPDIDGSLHDYIDNLVFGDYLEMYVKENEAFLKTAIHDLEGYDTLTEYISFNDLTQDANVGINCYIDDYLKTVDLELVQQIALN